MFKAAKLDMLPGIQIMELFTRREIFGRTGQEGASASAPCTPLRSTKVCYLILMLWFIIVSVSILTLLFKNKKCLKICILCQEIVTSCWHYDKNNSNLVSSYIHAERISALDFEVYYKLFFVHLITFHWVVGRTSNRLYYSVHQKRNCAEIL